MRLSALRAAAFTAAVLLFCPLSARAAGTAPSCFDIPILSTHGENIDSAGLQINLLAHNSDGDTGFSRKQFDARARLASTASSLLVHIDVHAPDLHEALSADSLWTGDSVELFVSAGAGSPQRYQLIISPGLTAGHEDIRQALFDHRDAPGPLGDIVFRRKTAGGYVMDVQLPWAALGIRPDVGTQFGFNLYINHLSASNVRSQLAWRSGSGASSDPDQVNVVRLARKAGDPVDETVSVAYPYLSRLAVTVESSQPLSDLPLWASAGRIRSAGTVDAGNPNIAMFTFPLPANASDSEEVKVKIGKRSLPPVMLPDLAALRKEAFDSLSFGASAYVFSGASFPDLDYRDGALAQNVIGPYSVHTTCYDRDYNAVASPDKPGRYGAVSVVTSPAGFARTYFTTLYRSKSDLNWDDPDLKFSVKTPQAFGPDPAVMASHPAAVDESLRHAFFMDMDSNRESAVLLAGMDATASDDPDVQRMDCDRRDSRWWIDMKKKLGIDVDYTFVVRTPQGYDAAATKRWPLLVFLHGSGDYDKVPEKIAASGIQDGASRDFVLAAPSCTQHERWSPELVEDLVKKLLSSYRIDASRIYLTGLSMGGYGVYETAMFYPQRYAAIAPLCGAGDLADIDRIKSTPIWIFHGDADTTVSPLPDHAMVAALEKIGAPVRSTFYPGVGHDCWTATYHNPAFYDWLLQQHRADPSP